MSRLNMAPSAAWARELRILAALVERAAAGPEDRVLDCLAGRCEEVARHMRGVVAAGGLDWCDRTGACPCPSCEVAS